MRRQRFYDESRSPVWFSELHPEEFAVLHVDRASGHHRSAEGQRIANFWTRDIPVFPDRASALEYSRERVAMFPALACRIYSADGSADVPVDEIVNDAADEVWTPARARRRIAWGLVLIAVGVFGVWIDWVYEWFYILGVIVGIKFLTVGLVRLVEGIVHLSPRRADRSAASESRSPHA